MSKIQQEIEQYELINTNDANLIEKLYDGSMGTIYKLKNATQPLAIKCIKNVKILTELISQEQEALEVIGKDSDQVMKQYCIKQMPMLENNEKCTAQVIFMKYYQNNLRKQMQTGINRNQFRQIFCNMICAFSDFECKRVFCSNLQPENIFLEEIQENQFKCIFSGLIRCPNTKQNAEKNFKILKQKYAHYGVSQYASPELFQCKSKDPKLYAFDPYSSDIYSAGVILLELLNGSSAIKSLHEAKIANSIEKYDKVLDSLLSEGKIGEEEG